MSIFNLFKKQDLKIAYNDICDNSQKREDDKTSNGIYTEEHSNETTKSLLNKQIPSVNEDNCRNNICDDSASLCSRNETRIKSKFKEEFDITKTSSFLDIESDKAELIQPGFFDNNEISLKADNAKFQNNKTNIGDNLILNSIDYSEVKKRYVLGDLGGTFYQIPFFASKSEKNTFHRNDIIADIAKIGDLLVMGASLRGESHYAHKLPRQDSFLIENCIINNKEKFIIAAIADGVGNAKKSDEFSEMLVNFLCDEVTEELNKIPDLEKIDWIKVSENIWKISMNYCYQKSGSKNIDDYFQFWASTLECIVIEADSNKEAKFISVTISGDGGVYKLDSSNSWCTIKHGKTLNDNAISNLVYCLPDKPSNLIIQKGCLCKGEKLFLVTDGLSDYIEAYGDVRQFFMNNLPSFANLPEFIRVLNVAIKQMDDDKTGILISFFDENG